MEEEKYQKIRECIERTLNSNEREITRVNENTIKVQGNSFTHLEVDDTLGDIEYYYDKPLYKCVDVTYRSVVKESGCSCCCDVGKTNVIFHF